VLKIVLDPQRISIHAPRGGSDDISVGDIIVLNISIQGLYQKTSDQKKMVS